MKFTCPIAQAAGSIHCQWCRDHAGDGFPVTCPDGFTRDKLPVGLGDVAHVVGKAVNAVVKATTGKQLPCFDQAGELKARSRCAEKRAAWNKKRVL